MLGTGLPIGDVDSVRASVVEMWSERPGGWVHEWSVLAAQYAAQKRHDLATLAYGWATFPVLADDAERAAFTSQLEQYVLASTAFPARFERQVLDVSYQDSTTPLPVHLLSPPTLAADSPVIIASGGVDTWKMHLHLLFVALALSTGAQVLAFDIPGTGEAKIPLSRESTGIIDALIAAARELGNGRALRALDGRLLLGLQRSRRDRRRSSRVGRTGRGGVRP